MHLLDVRVLLVVVCCSLLVFVVCYWLLMSVAVRCNSLFVDCSCLFGVCWLSLFVLGLFAAVA